MSEGGRGSRRGRVGVQNRGISGEIGENRGFPGGSGGLPRGVKKGGFGGVPGGVKKGGFGGVPEGGPGGGKKCVFRRVFNNSPSRDKMKFELERGNDSRKVDMSKSDTFSGICARGGHFRPPGGTPRKPGFWGFLAVLGPPWDPPGTPHFRRFSGFLAVFGGFRGNRGFSGGSRGVIRRFCSREAGGKQFFL